MVKLSIIVPVYNNKNYLKKCIESIIKQKYENIEIILVNDGSMDGSDKICDTFQDLDNRIHVIHQKNQGCMHARQRGLNASKGQYVGFVDSDDWIAVDMYKLLMSVAEKENCDIVSMGYMTVSDKEEKEVEDGTLFGAYEKGKNMDTLLSNMMCDSIKKRRGVQPSLCTKIFKRKLLESVFAKVDRRITMGEDAAIFYSCCLIAQKIFIMKEYKYYYRVHSNSMCRNMNINTFNEIYFFYQYMKKVIWEHDEQYGLIDQLKKYLLEFINLGLGQVFDINIGDAYIFPYLTVEKNSNIILYGAGEVGQAYYNQIMENQYCNIVAWTDKNRCGKNGIIHPRQILNYNFSMIVIAIEKKDVADEVIKELTALGIGSDEIAWDIPQKITSVIS